MNGIIVSAQTWATTKVEQLVELMASIQQNQVGALFSLQSLLTEHAAHLVVTINQAQRDVIKAHH